MEKHHASPSFGRANEINDHFSLEGIYAAQAYLSKYSSHGPWACRSLFWTCLGGLLLAQNIPPSGLPSGLPDDLSDMSPFIPCLGNLEGMQPPRTPFYGEVDAIWLRRDRIDPISLQTLGNQGDVILSTDALTEPFRVGTRATVGHSCGDSCWQVNATYFYIDTWDDSAAVRSYTLNPRNIGGTGDMFSPFTNFGHLPIVGLDYNDFVNIREFSEFQSAELNFRYTVPMPHECLTGKLILGFRYISVNEQFDYFTHSNVPVLPPRDRPYILTH